MATNAPPSDVPEPMFFKESAEAEFRLEVERIRAQGLASTEEEAEQLALRELVLERRLRIQGERDLLADTAKFLGTEPGRITYETLAKFDEILQARIDRLAAGEAIETEHIFWEAYREAEHRAKARAGR